MSEISVLKDTLELVEKGVNLALITITNSKGSTPTVTGAQMAVLEDGSIIGTIGGGHVSLAIYQMACLLNFDIIILEDREEFLTYERFPLAKKLILGPVDDGLREYDINENSYIIIVTRGHKHDGEALEAVINSKAKYIGVIGSKKKIMNMFNNLKEKGIDEEELSSIYSPIGLDIADNTPGEIAVSILAEILAVKNNKSSLHLNSLIH